ncbi:MAG: 6-carboxytetrahydropterin synthase [Verrucomicrobiota bacterium]|nr:6-carboxytetrahydropterin synthase [Verrucomicrobiota bacterium]
MPYRVCKTFEIESGHMLAKHPEKCRFPHGHTRKVEFVLEADSLDANEMVCDFKLVKELMEEFVMRFDHAICMNTDDPQFPALKKAYGEAVIGFEKKDPTTEILAQTVFAHCKESLADYARQPHNRYLLRSNVRLVKVRLWETSSSWAEYRE